MDLFYAFVLLIAFYLMLVGEFLLPTGGLMGFGAAAAVISALAISFSHSMAAGLVMLCVILISTPLIVTSLVKVWPHTPIGRRMLNRRPGEVATVGPPRTTIGGTRLDELVGKFGIAKSHLLPSGLIVVDGEKIDAFSAGMPIDAGTEVVVIKVNAGRVQVRPVTDDDIAKADPTPKSPPSLEHPLESLDFE